MLDRVSINGRDAVACGQVMENYPRIYFACHTRHVKDPKTRRAGERASGKHSGFTWRKEPTALVDVGSAHGRDGFDDVTECGSDWCGEDTCGELGAAEDRRRFAAAIDGERDCDCAKQARCDGAVARGCNAK